MYMYLWNSQFVRIRNSNWKKYSYHNLILKNLCESYRLEMTMTCNNPLDVTRWLTWRVLQRILTLSEHPILPPLLCKICDIICFCLYLYWFLLNDLVLISTYSCCIFKNNSQITIASHSNKMYLSAAFSLHFVVDNFAPNGHLRFVSVLYGEYIYHSMMQMKSIYDITPMSTPTLGL